MLERGLLLKYCLSLVFFRCAGILRSCQRAQRRELVVHGEGARLKSFTEGTAHTYLRVGVGVAGVEIRAATAVVAHHHELVSIFRFFQGMVVDPSNSSKKAEGAEVQP